MVRCQWNPSAIYTHGMWSQDQLRSTLSYSCSEPSCTNSGLSVQKLVIEGVRLTYIYKEGWAPKNWSFQNAVLEKTLESPIDCKEIKQISPQEINPEYSWEGLMLKLQYFGHLMQRVEPLEKTLMLGKIDGKRRGWQRTTWLDSIIDSVDMNLCKLSEIVKDRQAWCAAVHGVAKSWMWLSNWKTTN